MKTLAKAGVIAALVVTLSGCLATVAAVGGGLMTGIAAACNEAEDSRSNNLSAVEAVCGSAFKE